MSKHRVVVSVGVIALALIAVAAGFVLLAQRMAQAQSSSEAEPGDPPSVPAQPPQFETMFEPYPADEGAQTYDDLSLDERAAVDRAAQWAEADHGYPVHQRWRKASRQAARISKLRHAEYLSGLRGLDELGVQ
jgi:hypothetical protein